MRAINRRGYTLIELVVTILIIGVLSSFAIPQYLRTIEGGKADDAVAVMNMVGTTNKMFALDHNGYYVYGQFPSGTNVSCATVDPSCTGVGACPTGTVSAPVSGACKLVCCKYLADQAWGDKPYTVNACDASGGSGGGGCSSGYVSATARAAGAYSPYSTWGYKMSASGAITANNASTPPPTY